MRVAAIIAAGGRGARIGGAVPKQFLRIGARTMLQEALRPFDESPRVGEIVVALPPDVASAPTPPLLFTATPLQVVAGGNRRQDSVAAGLQRVSAGTDIVVVHDAARPFCTVELIARTIDAAVAAGAAVPALQVSDTVKEGRKERGEVFVRSTLPRTRVYLAQTPQAFRLEVLADAIAQAVGDVDATDDAMLVERAGHPVRLIDGDSGNVKVTTPADLVDAAARATGYVATPRPPRIGFGYDSHRLVEGRALVLGGVSIAHDRGLAGHSDADAVCHAITDAILGAAGERDIGQQFPNTDARWKGASSLDLLNQAVALVRESGLSVSNVDVVVIAEQPRLTPHTPAMRDRLAAVLGVAASHVSVKAKTAEGLDAIGQGKAIAVHAVTLLVETRP